MSYCIGILSALLWGASFVFTKHLLVYMTPYEVVFYRYLLSGLFLLVFIKKGQKKKQHPWKYLMFVSFLGIAFYPVLSCFALKYLSATMAGILNGTIPLLTVLGERFFRKKALTVHVIMALILSSVGILILTKKGDGQSAFIGILLTIISLIAWVAFTFMNEPLLKTYKETELLCYESLIGAVMVMPFVLYSKDSFLKQIDLMTNPVVVKQMIILSILVSACGYLCYMYGLKKLGVAFMAFVMNLLPCFAVLIAFVMLQEKISSFQLVGLLMISVSVLIINKKPTAPKIKKRTLKKVS